MRYSPALVRGRLIRRYKRFLADVEVAGETMVVHCANPGRMTTCAPTGAPVWLFDSQSSSRKLRFTWELVQVGGDMVCVNTARANQLVGQALEQGAIDELRDYDELAREVALGQSRIDFRLRSPTRGGDSSAGVCWVEVKTVTLRSGKRECSFPDSVTARGLKHLETLIEVAQSGARAVLLFVCGRTPTDRVRPADEIDPDYANTLRLAVACGVEVLCYGTAISTKSIELTERIPVVL